MEYYKVPQPIDAPTDQRKSDLLSFFLQHSEKIDSVWRRTSHPYYPWKKFASAYRAGIFGKFWINQDVTAEELWYLVGMKRKFTGTASPIKDTSSKLFTWSKLPIHEKMLHDFDFHLGGNMATDKRSVSISNHQSFLRQSLIEEAIASSQLEGAATTRDRAKKMFAENRKPTSEGEWMIYNNYQTIKKIEEETSNYPLSKETLLELHKIMTANTDLGEDKIGRWRKDSDDIVVHRPVGQEYKIAHVPPTEIQIGPELDKLINFANDEDNKDHADFIHPIIRAIMLHFWFAYIHPFCDGNGRLSRSLFYWYLLRHKYWLISYIPISTVIKESPSQYADAYCFSEQYSNDLTFFIDYNLIKLQQAVSMFNQYTDKLKEKSQEIDRLLPDKNLNNRQKQVLHHLIGKPEDGITVTQHANFHDVSWLTASQDIKPLLQKGYLASDRRGTSIIYRASEKLKSLNQ